MKTTASETFPGTYRAVEPCLNIGLNACCSILELYTDILVFPILLETHQVKIHN